MEESILMKQIIGTVGSGKGFVLANKVVEKLAEGKSVRVLSFEGNDTKKKIEFFSENYPTGTLDNLQVIDVSRFSTADIVSYTLRVTEFVDVVFVDVPIILNRNIDRPYYASMSSYLNLMRSVVDFTQTELWMAIQSNRSRLSEGACVIVVDEEDTDKHEIVTLDTMKGWVGQYSKSVYSK